MGHTEDTSTTSLHHIWDISVENQNKTLPQKKSKPSLDFIATEIPAPPPIPPTTTTHSPRQNNNSARTPPPTTPSSSRYSRNDGLFSAHHIAYRVEHHNDMKRIINLSSLSDNIRKHNTGKYEYITIENEKAIIEVRPKIITIWIKHEALLNSDNVDFIIEYSEYIARKELQRINDLYDIYHNEKTFKTITEPHIVVNDFKIIADKENKIEAEQAGVILGDRSHQTNIEFIKDSVLRAKTFIWLLDTFPTIFKEFYEQDREFKNTIQQSLLQILDILRQMRG